MAIIASSISTSAPPAGAVPRAAVYLAATRARSSCHELTDKASISDEAILEIIRHAVTYTPTAYDSHFPMQVVAMFGDHHRNLWSIITETLRGTLSGETLALAETRINNGLAPGHGTILFFTNTAAVTEAKSSHPSYAHGFDAWATQSQGNLQGTIWTALSLEGMGASLQYYHVYAGVNEAIRKIWDIPETWEISTQMPFGVPREGWIPTEEAFPPIGGTLVFQ